MLIVLFPVLAFFDTLAGERGPFSLEIVWEDTTILISVKFSEDVDMASIRRFM